MDQRKIGGFLKELRKEKGLTQEQLAERLSVSNRTVSRWETGSNLPDLSVLVDLTDFYGIGIHEIIDGERQSTEASPANDPAMRIVADYVKTEQQSNRQKKILRRGLMAIAAALVFFVLGPILNHRYGNPVSAALAKHNAQTLLNVRFGGNETESGKCEYQAKKTHYCSFEVWGEEYQYIVEAVKEGSPDSTISLTYGMTGNYIEDDAEAVLQDKSNTLYRMCSEYNNLVLKAVAGTKYDYQTIEHNYCLPFIITVDEKEKNVPGINPSLLTLDQQFDYGRVGKTAGKITLSLHTEPVTAEGIAENLLEIRRILDNAGIGVSAVTVRLSGKDGSGNPVSVSVENFPYGEINADGLAERVKEEIDKY